MEDELFRGGKRAWIIFGFFYVITIEGRDAQENVMFYSPQKKFDQSN